MRRGQRVDRSARAVRAVRPLRKELGTEHGTIQRVADQLGIGTESLRARVRRADVDDDAKRGTTSVDAARSKGSSRRRRVQSPPRRLARRVAHAHRPGPRRARDDSPSRGGRRPAGLVAHSDAGSPFTAVRFTERLDEIGASPSIGTIADSYDNALGETVNGLCKTECIYGPDARKPADDVDEVELATLSWVSCATEA